MPIAVFLLIILPLIEIFVFIEVGSRIGALTTVALIVATAAAGLILFRLQGFVLVSRLRTALEDNTPPIPQMLDGLGLALMAVLLLIPGFVTDVAGLLLAIPAIRRAFLRTLLIWLRGRVKRGEAHIVINGSYRDASGPRTDPSPTEPPRLDRQ